MIDSNEINAAITAKVQEAVSEQVSNLFKNDEQLLANLRSQAVSLLVRNFNLDALAKQDLAQQVATAVADLLVSQGADSTFLDSSIINNTVASSIASAASDQIGALIQSDPTLLGHLKVQAIAALVRQITVDNNVEAIIANKIAEQFAAQFDGTGIHSDATKRELTIMNDSVVVENTLTSRNVSVVDQLATKNATVTGNLLVHGTVDTTTGAWNDLASSIKLDVIDQVLLTVKQEMVDAVISQSNNLNFTSVNLNGTPVLSNNTLGSQITDSSLTSVGKLNGLEVVGTSTIDALHVEGKRVGINTRTPNSALAVWDEEVEIIAGKLKAQTAFIGTNRSQELAIGVNRREDLKIDADGVVTVQKFKIGSRTIKHGSSVPGYAGVPGDLVLNTLLTVDNPIFAWYCLHDYSWIELKAVI